jgi:hypothetical protein
LATYRRTGNTFLRKYLEKVTGVVTGSNMSSDVCSPLWLSCFMGEEVVDDRVWFVKTHFPHP